MSLNLVLGITSVQKPHHNIQDDVTKKISLSFYNWDARSEPFRHVDMQIDLDDNQYVVAKKLMELAEKIENLR